MEVTSGFTGSLRLDASSSPLIPASFSPIGNLCRVLSGSELEPHQVVIERLAFGGVEAPLNVLLDVQNQSKTSPTSFCSAEATETSAPRQQVFPPRPYRGGHPPPPPCSGAQLRRCARASAEQEAVREGGQAGPRGARFPVKSS